MKPPRCCVCGRREDPGFAPMAFADFEPLPEEMCGHPVGLEWFCSEHVKSAQALTHLPSREAVAKVRHEGTLGASVRRELRRRSSLCLTTSVVFALLDALVAVCIGIDVFQQGRLHLAFGRGGLVFPASMQLAFVGTSTQTWRDALTRLLDASF